MVAAAQARHGVRHAPVLHPPWFAPQEGVTLHRYLDDQFVLRFQQDARGGKLCGTAPGPRPATLPLPLHQAFHLVCCEVSCDAYGVVGGRRPAFAPQRIGSARFVIRRGTPGATQRWLLSQGEALGWRAAASDALEPDQFRRLVNAGQLPPLTPEPPYSGEESYPMHPLLVRVRQEDGTARSHTLLWGYLPLGGSYRAGRGAEAPAELPDATLLKELPWPFGSLGGETWRAADSRPARRGYAGEAFYRLLDLLLTRYRISDASDPDNAALRGALGAIRFYPPAQGIDADAPPDPAGAGDSLLEWIDGSRDALLLWLTRIGSGSASPAGSPLPRQTGTAEDGTPQSTGRSEDLYLSEKAAAQLRDALVQRARRAVALVEEGLSLPRFGQGKDDLFHVVPFVRWTDEAGCERIRWGEPGLPFRVASPFDTSLQPTRTVVLPPLAELKKGSPRGITFLAPKSTADLIRKLKPTLDFEEGGAGNGPESCWSFSFSIPAITLCAMILLMIIINLLNLIFFWVPWVFVALPRMCGKLTSEDSHG